MARTVSGPQTAATSPNSSRFSSSPSGAASITSSQPARSARLGVGVDPLARRLGVRLAPAPARGALGEASREPHRRPSRRPRRRCRRARVSKPPRPASWAMPAPIVPAPTTPTRLTRHRPLKSGSRFSRKACIPSTRSSVAIASSNRRALAREPVGERRSPRPPAPPAWRGGRRSARASATVARQLDRLGQPAAFADDHVDQAPVVGRLGVEEAAGEHVLHRPLLADRPRQALGAAAAGNDPERDLGLAEPGVSSATIMSQASASSQPPPSA